MMPPAPQRTSNILAAFVRHKNAANLFMALMILFGLWGVSQLNRQLMPTTETRSVSVTVAWSGASAEDVEKNILLPIEPAVRYLDGVTGMSSRARESSASITLEFERNTNMEDAEALVEAAVQAVPNLPEGAEAPEVSTWAFRDPVASIGLSGPVPEETLRRYAREFRDGLLDAGLDQVTMTGYRDREIVIAVDETKLRQLDVTLQDLSNALTPNIDDQPSGSLPGDFNAQIRAAAPEVSATALGEAELKSTPTGDGLRFNDIATISDQFSEDDALGFMRGDPAIKLTVSRSLSADTISSYETVKAYVEEVRPTLPPTLNIEVFDAAAEQVNDRLMLLVTNGAAGMLLVLVVLFLFLDFRIAFWVAIGIPVSILATLGIMYLTGQTINMISMFALLMTLGIIVDDAIVVGEHTATRFTAGDSRSDAAINGAGRMAVPVIAASLTTLAAFGPILLIGDVVGQIMAALPMVVFAVLLSSLIECFFILPGHLAHALPKIRKRPNRFRRGFDKGFDWFREHIVGWLIDLAYRWRYATVAIAVAITMTGGALLASGDLRFQFFPSSEGESFNIFASFQPGIPQDEMRSIIGRIEDAVTEVENELAPDGEVLVQTTYANLDLENAGANFDVYLTASEVRTVRTDVITAAIREAIPAVAGVQSLGVRQRRGGPQGRAIDVEFTGADTAVLKQASEDLQDVLEGFDGVTSISDSLNYGSPELVMSLTPRAAALGFDLNTLGTQVRDAFEGREVRTIAAQEEEITIRLERLSDGEGSAALRELWVKAPSGGYVPVSALVNFEEHQGFDRINREEGRSTVSVRADVEGDVDSNDVLASLTDQYLPEIAGRYGITYELGGRAAERAAAFSDLGIGALFALGVMYIIISWIFQSYWSPIAVLLIIPFGSVGAIWGHWLMGFDLTIVSLMGLLGLAGILVNDSIVLISRMQEQLEDGQSLREAMTGAARDRLRAVLLTSLTTIGGLSPLLFEKSLQAQFLIPMVITIVFGLALSTLLVLFLVPAFVAIGADVRAFLRWLFLTSTGSTFRELMAGRHHDRRNQTPAE